MDVAAIAFGALVLSTACAPAVQNITLLSSDAVAPNANQATIVIVQPSTKFKSVSILDGRGQLVAQLNARSHTVLQVRPGPVRLYLVVENQKGLSDRIDGTVLAGRVYYATVSLRWGGPSFLALNSRSPNERWSQKEHYLSSTPRVQMDPQKVVLAAGQIGDPTPILQTADAFVEKLDPPHRAERVIQPEDGI